MLNWGREAWAKYNELRDRYDDELTKALEDALDLIDSDPTSAEARQSRLTGVEDDKPTVWIVDAPPNHPLLRIYWYDKDGPEIAYIEEA